MGRPGQWRRAHNLPSIAPQSPLPKGAQIRSETQC
jgi:uncharacterized protein YkwD